MFEDVVVTFCQFLKYHFWYQISTIGKQVLFKHLMSLYSSHHFIQSIWSKGISETNLKPKIPCSKCSIGLWCLRPMHAHHTLMHACTAGIAPWCHRLIHAVIAWALLFWIHLGYTFISSYFDFLKVAWKTRIAPSITNEYLETCFSIVWPK